MTPVAWWCWRSLHAQLALCLPARKAELLLQAVARIEAEQAAAGAEAPDA